MSRIIAVASQKGGVAKTTSTLNIGAELSNLGQRVLLVDMDPQGHLAEGLGFSALELEHDISEALSLKTPLVEILKVLSPTLHLAPSNIYLAHLELEMVQMVRREDRLKGALGPLLSMYDYILIDCPPSLGILTVNAFSAAGEVLIPMATDFYSLHGVSLLTHSIEQMRIELNPQLEVIGILPTRMDRRTRHATEVIEKARQSFDGIPVLDPPIPEVVAVKESSAAGVPLRDYAPHSPATIAYRQIAERIIHGA